MSEQSVTIVVNKTNRNINISVAKASQGTLPVGSAGQFLTLDDLTLPVWVNLNTEFIVADSVNKRFVTDALLAILGNTSGTNTGDETGATIKTKLGTASSVSSGYLTSTDWNTFNSKQAALGFTPYNSSNPSGYISGITSLMVTNALTFTPYNATNPSAFISGITKPMVEAVLTGVISSHTHAYEPAITAGTALQYWTGSKTWATMPTTLPASDVYAWAKASVKPSYLVSEISGAAPLASPAFTGTTTGITATMVGLSNVTNDSQVKRSEMGAASGVATLDGTSKVPLAQIPVSLLGQVNYLGNWNASTNSPTLPTNPATSGIYYIVTVAGTTSLGGISDWQVGDWIIANGSVWGKVDNTDTVVTVNGFSGAVVLTSANISEVTNLYYTDARVTANTNVAANTAARHSILTLGTANGLSLVGQALSLQTASSTLTGALLAADWVTFNGKQNAITAAALTANNDTNVTLTLGGTPASALLAATSLTLGWTGTLADARIASAATWNAKQTGSTSLTSLSGLSYASTSFVKMTGANTFALDTTVYVSGTPWTGMGYLISGGALGTPSSGTLTNCTFPTLNQSTTGSAASFTGSLSGDVTGTQSATAISATTVTGKLITGFVSGAGTVSATDSILTAINKLNGNIAALSGGGITAVSIATANGVSGSSSGGTTPALTIALGAITPTSTNGVLAATMAYMDATSSVQTQINGKQVSSASLTSLSGLSYVSTSFVKMTAAGTFGLDTNTYVTGTPWTGMGYLISGGALGTPSGGTLTNCTFPTLNQNTTGTAANITATSNTTLTSISTLTTIGTLVAGGVPYTLLTGTPTTWNQNTTGSAATLTTARTIAGASFNGSANITLANKFIVQGTADSGLSGPQFLGALGTGILMNTTTTGVLSIATGANLPVMTSTVGGAVPTPPNNVTTFLRGDGTFASVTVSDVNGNFAINNTLEGYATTATAGGTTILTVSSPWQQYFTGTLTQTVQLPLTTTLQLGFSFLIDNNSTGALTINTSSSTLVFTMAPGTQATITCILASGTTAASWNVQYLGGLVATGKKLTVSNSITLAGTDGTTMTFPSTSATVLTTAALVTVAQGGTGVSTSTGSGNLVLSTSPTLVTPILGTPTSGNLANCTFPTLNQSTTGTAAGLSATLAVTSGGTGLTTLTTAYGILCAGTTATGNIQTLAVGTAGQLLMSNGAALPVWSTATFPTTAGTSGNILTSNGTNWISQAPAVTASTTLTWTNKRNQPRVYNTTSTSTLTPEIATYDNFELTAQAAALNIANHSTSTPAAGEKMMIRILDNGTARAITFGTYYRALGNALPTTTTASKVMYLGFIWNVASTTWDLIAYTQQT